MSLYLRKFSGSPVPCSQCGKAESVRGNELLDLSVYTASKSVDMKLQIAVHLGCLKEALRHIQ